MDDLKNLRLLIVEDEALIAEEICDRLEKLGVKVVGVADTAEQAIALAETEQPDIILMDVRLRGNGDGIRAASTIYARFSIPSVFLTAYSDRDTIERILGIRQFGYMTKPFREKDLVTTLGIAYQHHRVETGLRDSDLSMKAVFANSSDGLIATDNNERIRFINLSASELIGKNSNEALTRHIDEILRLADEKTGELMKGLFGSIIAGDAPPLHNEDFFLRVDEKQSLPVSVSAAAVRNANNDPVGAAISLRSLADKRKAEEDKSEAEKKLADQRLLIGTLVDGLPELFFATDRDLTIIFANHALMNWFDLKRHEVIGRKVSDIFSTGNLADIDQQVAAAIRTGRPIMFQQRACLDSAGELRWLSFHYTPLFGSSEVALACTARDVTDVHQIQSELLETSSREQRRIGRDLHDTLGQELSSLAMLINSHEKKIELSLPDLLEDTGRIKDSIRLAIESMRATVRGLAPMDLESNGLIAALRALAARCDRVYGVPCEFSNSIDRLPEIPQAITEHIYRFVQEGLNNAARHASATGIQLNCSQNPQFLSLTITDNGAGIGDISIAQMSGFGLRIMEHRAHKMGGTMEIVQSEQGTQIKLQIPTEVLRALSAERLRAARKRADDDPLNATR